MNQSETPKAKGTFAQRITAAPQLSAAETAHARVERWLAEIGSTAAGRTLARLLAVHPTVNTLMAAVAEGSPYLWELARAQPERLVAILVSAPERRFADPAEQFAVRQTAAAESRPHRESVDEEADERLRLLSGPAGDGCSDGELRLGQRWQRAVRDGRQRPLPYQDADER